MPSLDFGHTAMFIEAMGCTGATGGIGAVGCTAAVGCIGAAECIGSVSYSYEKCCLINSLPTAEAATTTTTTTIHEGRYLRRLRTC